MISTANELQLKTINELLGLKFIIPHYQRGYRWTTRQVTELLDDIEEFRTNTKDSDASFYCLQPIVVNPVDGSTDNFEVIDGQQRLTTLFIIIKCLSKALRINEHFEEDYLKPLFTLSYTTRAKSEAYLNNIVEDNTNMDYYYIFQAYKAVEAWLTVTANPKDSIQKRKFLDTILGKKTDNKSVQIIWYSINDISEGKEALFNRLNNGKIPLTNAELIKALFLAKDNVLESVGLRQEAKKLQISQQWDAIEQELHNEKFWAFISNKKMNDYQSKIELILDLVAKTSNKNKDPLATFLYFYDAWKTNDRNILPLWLEIENCFLTLKQWFTNKNNYHRIGYLIATGASLKDLLALKFDLPKSEFEEKVKGKIKNLIPDNYKELEYDNGPDRKNIEKVLLLHNIECINKNDTTLENFPFAHHKRGDWTLEHINAQNEPSISQSDKKLWEAWIKLHYSILNNKLVIETTNTKLKTIIVEIDKINYTIFSYAMFEDLYKKIVSILQVGDKDATHHISNMALLTRGDNAAIGNAVFAVKRQAIIEMDRKGHFIPIATKQVFLKYYSDSDLVNNNAAFTSQDADDYMAAIEESLNTYLN